MPTALAGNSLRNPGIIHLSVDTIPVRGYHIDTQIQHLSVSHDIGEYFDAVIGFVPRPPGFIEILPENMVNVKVHLTGARQLAVTLNEEELYLFDYVGGKEGWHHQSIYVDLVRPMVPGPPGHKPILQWLVMYGTQSEWAGFHSHARGLQQSGGTEFLLTFYIAISGGDYVDPNRKPEPKKWWKRAVDFVAHPHGSSKNGKGPQHGHIDDRLE